MPRPDDDARSVVITDAAPAVSDELAVRHRRYLVSMGIRMACFLGLVLAPSPWRWWFLAGAAVIPPVAVLFANIGSRPPARSTWVADEEDERPALPSHEVIAGEVITGEVAPSDRVPTDGVPGDGVPGEVSAPTTAVGTVGADD